MKKGVKISNLKDMSLKDIKFQIIVLVVMIILWITAYITINNNSNKSKYPCIKEGEQINEWPLKRYEGPKYCCDGLNIIATKYFDNGECRHITDSGDLCSNCGNNNCEQWENQCNCPYDCK